MLLFGGLLTLLIARSNEIVRATERTKSHANKVVGLVVEIETLKDVLSIHSRSCQVSFQPWSYSSGLCPTRVSQKVLSFFSCFFVMDDTRPSPCDRSFGAQCFGRPSTA
jgi:hypothetical protein